MQYAQDLFRLLQASAFGKKVALQREHFAVVAAKCARLVQCFEGHGVLA